jgi:hypothetical protein
MDQDTATPEQPFAPVLAAAQSMQLECLSDYLNVAQSTLMLLRYGADADRDDPRQAAWGEIQDEILGLTGDVLDARPIAREREVGAEIIARARHSNHLDAIARAEQMLAAERARGAAA